MLIAEYFPIAPSPRRKMTRSLRIGHCTAPASLLFHPLLLAYVAYVENFKPITKFLPYPLQSNLTFLFSTNYTPQNPLHPNQSNAPLPPSRSALVHNQVEAHHSQPITRSHPSRPFTSMENLQALQLPPHQYIATQTCFLLVMYAFLLNYIFYSRFVPHTTLPIIPPSLFINAIVDINSTHEDGDPPDAPDTNTHYPTQLTTSHSPRNLWGLTLVPCEPNF